MTEPTCSPPTFPARFNLARHLLEARVAEGRGARTAIITPAITLSYRAVEERAARLAHALCAAGVQRGDRVLWALPDGPDFAAALFATLKLGAVGAMANPDVPAADHAHLIAYTRAAVFITTAAVAGQVAEAIRAAPALRACFIAGEDGDTAAGGPSGSDDAGGSPHGPPLRSLAGALAAAPATPFPAADTAGSDVAMWLFTSGSTGAPKAAVHAHQDFAYHIECYAKALLGLVEDDVVLAVPRLYFPYATGMNLMFPFAVGAAAIHAAVRPTPEGILDLAARYQPTVLVTVPTMTAKLLAVAGTTGAGDGARANAPFARLRLAVTAGEALPPELHRRWNQSFAVPLLDGIGSAEMFHIYISNRPDDVRPGSLGRLVPGYEARVVRADGTDAGLGEPGRLWVRGGSMMSGYFDEAEQPPAGWVISSDVFRRDGDGYFFYEGRADDMLKVGGIFVSPLEVENVIAAHPAVAECAVVGHEDEHGLVKPRAFVVPSPGTSADDRLWQALSAHCREHLARYKVPRWFVARTTLPRNDRGKIVRRLLRD